MIIIDENFLGGIRVQIVRDPRGNYLVFTNSPTKSTLSRELNQEEAVREFHETLSSLRSSSFAKGGAA